MDRRHVCRRLWPVGAAAPAARARRRLRSAERSAWLVCAAPGALRAVQGAGNGRRRHAVCAAPAHATGLHTSLQPLPPCAAQATSAGHAGVVQHLVDWGCNLDLADQNGWVRAAGIQGRGRHPAHACTPALQPLLLQQCPRLLAPARAGSFPRRPCPQTALHLAADRGHVTIAEMLVEGGAELDCQDVFGWRCAAGLGAEQPVAWVGLQFEDRLPGPHQGSTQWHPTHASPACDPHACPAAPSCWLWTPLPLTPPPWRACWWGAGQRWTWRQRRAGPPCTWCARATRSQAEQRWAGERRPAAQLACSSGLQWSKLKAESWVPHIPTPTHPPPPQAADDGRADRARLLLRAGCLRDPPDIELCTPLMLAADDGAVASSWGGARWLAGLADEQTGGWLEEQAGAHAL